MHINYKLIGIGIKIDLGISFSVFIPIQPEGLRTAIGTLAGYWQLCSTGVLLRCAKQAIR